MQLFYLVLYDQMVIMAILNVVRWWKLHLSMRESGVDGRVLCSSWEKGLEWSWTIIFACCMCIWSLFQDLSIFFFVLVVLSVNCREDGGYVSLYLIPYALYSPPEISDPFWIRQHLQHIYLALSVCSSYRFLLKYYDNSCWI